MDAVLEDWELKVILVGERLGLNDDAVELGDDLDDDDAVVELGDVCDDDVIVDGVVAMDTVLVD